MSADNGVYILRTRRTCTQDANSVTSDYNVHYVWRVAHLQAMDLDWYEKIQVYNVGAYLNHAWGGSHPYKTLEAAMRVAAQVLKSLEVCEYGIQCIDTEYIFYGDY